MKQQDGKPRLFSFTLRDFLIFAAIFICALVLCTLLRRSDISDGFASPRSEEHTSELQSPC